MAIVVTGATGNIVVPPNVLREHLIDAGLPGAFASAYIAMLADTLDEPALVTYDVEKILGRQPRTFAEWVSGTSRILSAGGASHV